RSTRRAWPACTCRCGTACGRRVPCRRTSSPRSTPPSPPRWPTGRLARSLAGSGRKCRRPTSRTRRRWLPSRRPRSTNGGRSSRRPASRATDMKLGVLQFFSWPGRHGPLEEVYARALERIEIMDKTGFDAVWLAEHHFTTYSVCPSVHMMGVLAAARTKRLRIGTAVSLAALYHPVRLAEEVALLDVLSGGRVNW